MIENTGPGTGNRDVDGLLFRYKWSSTQLSFGFPTSFSQYGPDYSSISPPTSFSPFSNDHQTAARHIFQHISSFCGLTFTEAADPGEAVLRLALTDLPGPSFGGLPSDRADGGDVWIMSAGQLDNHLGPGGSGWYLLMHEIGHALGLTHTNNGSDNPPTTPEYDAWEFSVMANRSYPGGSANWGDGTGDKHPQSYMMLDVAALQYLYGANFSYNSDDSTYRWDPATGRMSVNGSDQSAPAKNVIFMTLWDGGGNDTYDLSNYANDLKIDLRPGQWTTTSPGQLADLSAGVGAPVVHARGNVANALLHEGDRRSLIENAIGGPGNDAIVGNETLNRLTGGAGSDSLNGLSGSDALSGDGGQDLIQGGTGADMLSGGAGGDIFAFESIQDSRVSALRSDGKKFMPDVVGDFMSGEDKLDLSRIDAIAATAADDPFSFVATSAFSGVSGELRYEVVGEGIHLLGDINGDGAADLHIIIAAPAIQLADLVL